MGDMHYFPGYLLEAGKTNGYCQRVSLSLGEVLRSMGVKSRQLHWQKDGVGFHQFIEYYNPYSDQWIIIDPYYGVKYKDKAGHFLGFEGIDQLKRAGTFDLSRIHKIEVNRFYFSEEEIINGWNADLAIHIL
ncbi:MAG: hypothetical protein OEX02_20865, partial [Cyclobacteriaceae bacterium]|nr:hypothetical protein [Cyclobacteriaceae bacterium]